MFAKKELVARLLSARHNLQSPTAAPFHADAAMGIEVTDTHPGHEDHKHSQPTRVGPPPPIERPTTAGVLAPSLPLLPLPRPK